MPLEARPLLPQMSYWPVSALMHFQEYIHTRQKRQNHTSIGPRIPHHLVETAFTFLPTASTRPATSAPSILFFGFRSPDSRRCKNGSPLRAMPVTWIHGCCKNFYQDFIFLGRRFFYLFELENIRWPVFCVYNCFHRNLLTLIGSSFRSSVHFADSEATADELNPLTISHTARTISSKAAEETTRSRSARRDHKAEHANKPDAKYKGAPIRPQTDIQRGRSFD